MRSGNLNHKIQIQRLISDDLFGESDADYELFTTVYSSVVPLSGKEYFSSKQLNAEVTHKITVRFIRGVLPSMRIVLGSRIFNIESILNIREANKTLQIIASEVI